MKKIIVSILLFSFLMSCTSNEGANKGEYESNILEKNATKLISVSTNYFNTLITNKNSTDIVLDVRTLEEYNQGHIESAILLDYYKDDFKNNLSVLDKDLSYYIYCRSGNRSGDTLAIMKNLGFTHVYNLDKGINDWNNNNLPVAIN